MDNILISDLLYNNRLHYQMLNRLFENEEKREQRLNDLVTTLTNRRPRRNRPLPPTRSILSIQNIINNTTLSLYSDISSNYSICPITRDNFIDSDIVLKINRCGHIFKRTALLNWFTTNNTCPTCRGSIINTTTDNLVDSFTRVFSNLHIN